MTSRITIEAPKQIFDEAGGYNGSSITAMSVYSIKPVDSVRLYALRRVFW